MNEEYYIIEGDNKKGPYTFTELVGMDLDIHTEIITPISDTPQYASELPEFDDYFKAQGVYFPTADNLAGFGKRALAFIIDYILLCVPIELILLKMNLLTLPKGPDLTLPAPHEMFIMQAAFFSAFFVYNIILEATPLKGSLGKKICKLVVVDVDGQSPGLPKSIGRTAGKVLSLFIYGLPFLTMLFNEHRQTWYDSLAKTYVIVTD